MTRIRTIAVITGTRADFGLLKPIMQAITQHPKLNLQVIASGLHLVQDTLSDITDAGFTIDAQIPMQRPGESGRIADAIATGMGIVGICAVLSRLRPDVVLVLGDRIEAMAGAIAASVGGFHLAHIHGGDRAQGVADEAMRHAISKLSHLHFAASSQSAKRLTRMGEAPQFIFNTGSPAIDDLADIPPTDSLDDIDEPIVVVMQHPVGLSNEVERKHMRATLKATETYVRFVIGPNHDPGYEGIHKAITQNHVNVIPHLNRRDFIGLLKRATMLVGNSSAGIIEASALRPGGLPVVNIGPRQNGREKPANVIDCDYGIKAVSQAIDRALYHPPKCRKHPYGDGQTSKRIADFLAKVNLKKLPLGKQNRY